eukprot:SAG31_NODE_31711_length_365_cov_0.661654_1_plen_65_part_10
MPTRRSGRVAQPAPSSSAVTVFDMNICMADRGGNLKNPVPIVLASMLSLIGFGLYALAATGWIPA